MNLRQNVLVHGMVHILWEPDLIWLGLESTDYNHYDLDQPPHLCSCLLDVDMVLFVHILDALCSVSHPDRLYEVVIRHLLNGYILWENFLDVPLLVSTSPYILCLIHINMDSRTWHDAQMKAEICG